MHLQLPYITNFYSEHNKLSLLVVRWFVVHDIQLTMWDYKVLLGSYENVMWLWGGSQQNDSAVTKLLYSICCKEIGILIVGINKSSDCLAFYIAL